MGRKAESVQEAIEILGGIFDLPKYRRLKCESLWKLAQKAKHCIVELGTAEGVGAIALALGANVPVYTIDDYCHRKGWANEPYGENKLEKFKKNVEKADVEVTLIRKNAYNIVWNQRVGLVFWDLGVRSNLQIDYDMWMPWCDTFAVHDTMNQVLGSKELPRADKVMPGGIWIWKGNLTGA